MAGGISQLFYLIIFHGLGEGICCPLTGSSVYGSGEEGLESLSAPVGECEALQGYLAHKKLPPPRTLQQDHASTPAVILWGKQFLMSKAPLKWTRVRGRAPAPPPHRPRPASGSYV